MERIVLTGIGPLTPIGKGKREFWSALMDGVCGIKKITKFSTMYPSLKLRNTIRDCYGGEINDINFNEHITDGRFRRSADISRYTMLAVKLAMDDANISSSNSNNFGIIIGLTHGALNYTQSYHKLLITEGAESVSPILFSDSVLNAPAGNASICFGIHGPVHTIIGGKTITTKAIILAAQMLTAGVVDKSIVVCAEELNELSFLCYSRLGLNSISEGAGAILLENETTQKGEDPYCYVSGIALQVNPLNPQMALHETIEKSLDMANLKEKDIDLVMVDSFIPDVQENYFSNKPVGCITQLTGNAFSASIMWSVIVSALIIKRGEIPVRLRRMTNNRVEIPDKIRNVMICVIENKGVASAMILSEYSR